MSDPRAEPRTITVSGGVHDTLACDCPNGITLRNGDQLVIEHTVTGSAAAIAADMAGGLARMPRDLAPVTNAEWDHEDVAHGHDASRENQPNRWLGSDTCECRCGCGFMALGSYFGRPLCYSCEELSGVDVGQVTATEGQSDV